MISIDPRILAYAKKIKGKRAKIVVNHIINYGSISTEDLKNIYGYNHPPRAAKDVIDQGLPLITTMIKGSNGRKMASYSFGNPDDIQENKLGGRVTFSKEFRKILFKEHGGKCSITLEKYDFKYLQIDHRIPYEIAGEISGTERSPKLFMLLSRSAQRQKSWECEHCQNRSFKKLDLCRTCYWAYPEEYTHVALQAEKRIDLIFKDKEIKILDKIHQLAIAESLTIKEFIIKHFSN